MASTDCVPSRQYFLVSAARIGPTGSPIRPVASQAR